MILLESLRDEPDFAKVVWVAQKFGEHADRIIPTISKQTLADCPWTKPNEIEGSTKFGGGKESREESMKRWIAGEDKKANAKALSAQQSPTSQETPKPHPPPTSEIIQPWEWLDVDNLPAGLRYLVYRSRRPEACVPAIQPTKMPQKKSLYEQKNWP